MKIKADNKIVMVLAALAVILCSGHAFQTIYSVTSRLVLPVAAAVLVAELYRLQNFKLDIMQIALFIFLMMIGATCAQYLGLGLVFYLMIACYVIGGYGIVRAYGFYRVARCHVHIMTVTTVIALIGYWLLHNTTLLNALPLVRNVNDVEYRVGIVFSYIPIAANRNCGMFWEPGLFATNLVIAFIFETMFQEKPSIWRLLLFVAGVVTANSAAGFALMLLCALLFVVKNMNFSRHPIIALLAVLMLIFGAMIVLNFDAVLESTSLGENEFMQKLSTSRIENSSRVNAIKHNLSVFATAPVFGVGIIKASAGIKHVADTSTSTYLMSVFGLPAVLYTAGWVYGILKIKKVNVVAKTLLILIALIIVNKEPHHQNLMTWCILFGLIGGDFAKPVIVKKERMIRFPSRWR